MATEILKSFSHLQNELDEAKSSLKGVDENIKRLIGRDPSEIPPRPGQKRPLDDKNPRQQFTKFSRGFENDDAPKRRNPNTVSVFKRLSEKVPDDSFKAPSRGLISKVIAAPKEVPSRQAALDKQNKDEKFKARNRRMFGALLGTLQRFQQEECKLKKKEEKRTQIEKKIDEHEQQEKEEIKKERQELFLNRKKKQQEIKMIELKMLRMKEYASWEQSQKPRASFIVTKAKPHIHFLPRKMDDKSKELLEKSKVDLEEQIEKRRQAVSEELSHIEERMKRKFETKNILSIEVKPEKPTTRHDRRGSDSEPDDDIDVKMRSPSPEPQDENEENEKKDEENGTMEMAEPTTLEVEVNHSEVDSQQNELPNNEAIPPSDSENHVETEQTIVNDVYDNIEVDSSAVAQVDTTDIYANSSEVSDVNVIPTNDENEEVNQDVMPEATQENI